MEIQIEPEPSDRERIAIEAALSEKTRTLHGRRSEWWHRGVRDAALGDAADEMTQSSSSNDCSTSQGAKPSRR